MTKPPPMLELPFSTGYCTNVHAGGSLAETRANLERHALAVKRRYSPERPMGVGLWLSSHAAAELFGAADTARRATSDSNGGSLAGPAFPTAAVHEFRDWLAERGLVPYTLNGFPYGDFHQEVVKHRVYEPTWWQPERLDYTLRLVDILHEILPPGLEGSISTLPIAWGHPCPDRESLERAAFNLRVAARFMHDLEEETGRLVYLCIEPEPGCVFSFADDAVHFFRWHLFGNEDEAIVRRHLRICHDVCHAAVMFEDQEEVLRKYQEAGIEVGKVQVSSAVRMDLDAYPSGEPAAKEAFRQLQQFNEPRYLHQTVVRSGADEDFYEDLPLAFAAAGDAPSGEWRTHFHVPIYLKKFGQLEATQEQIVQCLYAAQKHSSCRHYEVETYAWSVLPPELKQSELAAGIAEELVWFRQLLATSDASQEI